MDWFNFYMGGFIASLLFTLLTIIWNKNSGVTSLVLLSFTSAVWPIMLPITVLMGFTKFNKDRPNVKS